MAFDLKRDAVVGFANGTPARCSQILPRRVSLKSARKLLLMPVDFELFGRYRQKQRADGRLEEDRSLWSYTTVKYIHNLAQSSPI